MNRDLVVLVPGLLGFDAVSDFRYFHADVLDLLGEALEAAVGAPVAVVALSAQATQPLAERQAFLLEALADLTDPLERPRIHLVGHSTGGLDAVLSTAPHPLPPRSDWAELPGAAVREAVRTVVALAAPFRGTWLADTDMADVLDGFDWSDVLHLGAAGRALASLLPALWGDADRPSFAQAIRQDPSGALSWLWQARPGWRLVRDLSPARMQAVLPLRPVCLAPAVHTVATVTTLGEGAHQADAFFRLLYAHTSGQAGFATPPAPDPALDVALTRLTRAPRIIQHPDVPVPTLDQAANDGVVNTCRQLLDPTRPDELLALVVADHMDILGHYDRDPAHPQGILHSGARFGAPELREVWAEVAGTIARQCRPR